MHRLSGAWSWCVWCPTTHTRGWCHVYRDTSVQMQRRDMWDIKAFVIAPVNFLNKLTRSAVPGCVKMFASPTHFELSFFKASTVGVQSMIYFLCFLPHKTPQNAPQSVPRLYTGNGQVKTQITCSSTSLVLGTTCSISHSDICHLYSPCMTLFAFWDSLVKTGCRTLINVLHYCVTLKLMDVWLP